MRTRPLICWLLLLLQCSCDVSSYSWTLKNIPMEKYRQQKKYVHSTKNTPHSSLISSWKASLFGQRPSSVKVQPRQYINCKENTDLTDKTVLPKLEPRLLTQWPFKAFNYIKEKFGHHKSENEQATTTEAEPPVENTEESYDENQLVVQDDNATPIPMENQDMYTPTDEISSGHIHNPMQEEIHKPSDDEIHEVPLEKIPNTSNGDDHPETGNESNSSAEDQFSELDSKIIEIFCSEEFYETPYWYLFCPKDQNVNDTKISSTTPNYLQTISPEDMQEPTPDFIDNLMPTRFLTPAQEELHKTEQEEPKFDEINKPTLASNKPEDNSNPSSVEIPTLDETDKELYIPIPTTIHKPGQENLQLPANDEIQKLLCEKMRGTMFESQFCQIPEENSVPPSAEIPTLDEIYKEIYTPIPTTTNKPGQENLQLPTDEEIQKILCEKMRGTMFESQFCQIPEEISVPPSAEIPTLDEIYKEIYTPIPTTTNKPGQENLQTPSDEEIQKILCEKMRGTMFESQFCQIPAENSVPPSAEIPSLDEIYEEIYTPLPTTIHKPGQENMQRPSNEEIQKILCEKMRGTMFESQFCQIPEENSVPPSAEIPSLEEIYEEIYTPIPTTTHTPGQENLQLPSDEEIQKILCEKMRGTMFESQFCQIPEENSVPPSAEIPSLDEIYEEIYTPIPTTTHTPGQENLQLPSDEEIQKILCEKMRGTMFESQFCQIPEENSVPPSAEIPTLDEIYQEIYTPIPTTTNKPGQENLQLPTDEEIQKILCEKMRGTMFESQFCQIPEENSVPPSAEIPTLDEIYKEIYTPIPTTTHKPGEKNMQLPHNKLIQKLLCEKMRGTMFESQFCPITEENSNPSSVEMPTLDEINTEIYAPIPTTIHKPGQENMQRPSNEEIQKLLCEKMRGTMYESQFCPIPKENSNPSSVEIHEPTYDGINEQIYKPTPTGIHRPEHENLQWPTKQEMENILCKKMRGTIFEPKNCPIPEENYNPSQVDIHEQTHNGIKEQIYTPPPITIHKPGDENLQRPSNEEIQKILCEKMRGTMFESQFCPISEENHNPWPVEMPTLDDTNTEIYTPTPTTIHKPGQENMQRPSDEEIQKKLCEKMRGTMFESQFCPISEENHNPWPVEMPTLDDINTEIYTPTPTAIHKPGQGNMQRPSDEEIQKILCEKMRGTMFESQFCPISEENHNPRPVDMPTLVDINTEIYTPTPTTIHKPGQENMQRPSDEEIQKKLCEKMRGTMFESQFCPIPDENYNPWPVEMPTLDDINTEIYSPTPTTIHKPGQENMQRPSNEEIQKILCEKMRGTMYESQFCPIPEENSNPSSVEIHEPTYDGINKQIYKPTPTDIHRPEHENLQWPTKQEMENILCKKMRGTIFEPKNCPIPEKNYNPSQVDIHETTHNGINEQIYTPPPITIHKPVDENLQRPSNEEIQKNLCEKTRGTMYEAQFCPIPGENYNPLPKEIHEPKLDGINEEIYTPSPTTIFHEPGYENFQQPLNEEKEYMSTLCKKLQGTRFESKVCPIPTPIYKPEHENFEWPSHEQMEHMLCEKMRGSLFESRFCTMLETRYQMEIHDLTFNGFNKQIYVPTSPSSYRPGHKNPQWPSNKGMENVICKKFPGTMCDSICNCPMGEVKEINYFTPGHKLPNNILDATNNVEIFCSDKYRGTFYSYFFCPAKKSVNIILSHKHISPPIPSNFHTTIPHNTNSILEEIFKPKKINWQEHTKRVKKILCTTQQGRTRCQIREQNRPVQRKPHGHWSQSHRIITHWPWNNSNQNNGQLINC